MKRLTLYLRDNPLSYLLLALPLALIAHYGGWSPMLVFLFSAVGVIPLAGFIGQATEALAVHTGPHIGGLLNATLGNAAELIITLVAIRAGLLELVKASITGSILGNLLLVMGMSMVVGGSRHGMQTFNRRQVGNQAVLLTLSVLALTIPSLFSHSIGPETSSEVEALSLGVSVVMIVLYGLGLLHSLRNNDVGVSAPVNNSNAEAHAGEWSIRTSIIVLALATIGIVILSEMLVGAVESVVVGLGLSEFFLGIILIPIVGNVAEHLVAIQVASRNQMDLSVGIAVSSSLQIALFVAPLLVFISLLMGHPLTLVFNLFELIALGAAVLVSALVCIDGESNWLEGATLIAVYLILGISFFLLPAVKAMVRWLFTRINIWVILFGILVAGALIVLLGLLVWFLPQPASQASSAQASLKVILAPTPTVSPTLVVNTLTPTAPPSVGGVAVGNFVQIVGTEGQGLRLRSGPGTGNPPRFLGMDAEVFKVKDGPKTADGIIWWFLEAPYDPGRSGWAASNYLKAVSATPTPAP